MKPPPSDGKEPSDPEAALRESRQMLQLVLDTIPVRVFWKDLDSRYLGCNLPFAQDAGLRSPEELVGKDDWAMGWADRAEAYRADDRLVMDSGNPRLNFEEQQTSPEGRTKWLRTSKVPLLDATGNIKGMLGTYEDITAQKQAEEALRASEEHFRFLHDLAEATRPLADPRQIMAAMARLLGEQLRASRCAYAEVEPDGEQFTILDDYTDGCGSTVGKYRLSLFGPRAVATLNRGETLIIRNVAAELLPGEGADMFNAIGIQAIITCPLVKAGGLRAMMAVHQAVPRDWRPEEIILVQEVVERCWAMIERRAAEARLAEASGLLDAMLETSPDLIYFKDRDSRFVRFSKACYIGFGLTEPDLLRGKTDADFYAAAPEQPTLADEQEIIRTGRPIIDKLEKATYGDGRVTWLLTTKMPWRDGAGAIVGVWGISKDVAALKEAEAKLEQAQGQLVAASRQAGIAEFATGILHNVGNVLNSVNVASTCVADSLRKSKAANLARVVALLQEHEADLGAFLTSDPKGQKVPAYLAQLAEHLAAEQAGALKELAELQKNIEHIRDIVTMQQSLARTPGGTEAIDVNELVEDALKMNSSGVARHHIAVVKECGRVPPIMAERSKVLQILINLVSNAKQSCAASDQPEKRLTVRTTAENGRVRIAVTDNGVGIAPENLSRIFSHGFTTKKDGHGFGLHSAALTAAGMGGSLTVQSDGPGRGATFILELPAKPD